jgi:hypothetical protein
MVPEQTTREPEEPGPVQDNKISMTFDNTIKGPENPFSRDYRDNQHTENKRQWKDTQISGSDWQLSATGDMQHR